VSIFFTWFACWLQSRIEASEKSHQTIVNECMNLEQQLSASETSRLALRDQYEQLSREVEGYRVTIQQHVSLATSSKVRERGGLLYFVICRVLFLSSALMLIPMFVLCCPCFLWCFDTFGWVTGRASGMLVS